jgi:hypothetical protein
VTDRAGFTPVITPSEDRRANATVFGHVAVFLIGATSAIQIYQFLATLLTVVCLLLVPAFLLMQHRGVDVVPVVLAALGWISFTASCLVNGVSVLWPNALAPATFSIYFIGLTVLTNRAVELVATVLAGISVGTIFFFLTTGIALSNTGNFLDFWKYGIAHAVTILILFGLTIARVRLVWQSVALAMLGLITLALNYRAHAFVCLLAAATLLTRYFLGSRIARGWQLAGIGALGGLFAYVMPIAGRAGLFGPALQQKVIEQQATNLPMFLAGRTEPPMTFTAIAERPLLGWGSALNLTPDVYAQAEHLAVRMGYAPTFPYALYWRLPATDDSAFHSILLGSWAEGGVLAVLLPAWLLIACIGLVWNNARFGAWAPLALTVALEGIWDLLFNPWTYNMVLELVCIALFYCAVHFRDNPTSP